MINFTNKNFLDKIQKNLSYSYLHAIVSRLGGSCEPTTQDADNEGIDAHLIFQDNFSPKQIINRVQIDVQLKSTRQNLKIKNNKIIYSLPESQYNRYILPATVQLVFILFCVPSKLSDWVSLSDDELILRKCAYWTSLNNAPYCDKKTATIQIPTKNLITDKSLFTIVKIISEGGKINYEP
ncbi:MAG: DUF4365 domain-containing protein [Planctomycetaceae bacterium]|jgi:hypothetical protein|nr:DUF4365 domain-containing protein [Planctomycetaceae bacterium]